MTTLVCQTLMPAAPLTQEVRFTSGARLQVGAIIPYLYFHGWPPGDFSLTMTGPHGTVFSKSFTSDEVKIAVGTSESHAHVYYPMVPSTPVQVESGDYTFILSALNNGTYIPDDNSFLAWIQQHENIQNEMSYEPLSDEYNSFTIRFKGYKEGIQ